MSKTKELAPAPAKTAPEPVVEREMQPTPEKQPGRVQLTQARNGVSSPPPGNGSAAPGDTGAAGRARSAVQMQAMKGNSRLNGANGGTVQTKLTVNEPGDAHEKEADHVADQVMRTPEGVAAPGARPTVQRQPAEEKPVQRAVAGEKPVQRVATEEKPVQRAVAEERPLQRQPAEEKPIQRQPAEEKPVQRAVAEEKPVQRLPGEEKPVQRAIAEEKPVQRLPAEEKPVQRAVAEEKPVQRQPAEEKPVQRVAAAEEPIQREDWEGGKDTPSVSETTASTIRSPGPGRPMAPQVRERIEPHLGADLSGVRVHTDAPAHRATLDLSARAFTYQSHIFLSPAESATDARLMGHEATHVVQQGAALGRGPALLRSPADDRVQRLPDFVKTTLADYARHIPGYTLFTLIIGFDPLRGERVRPTATNLLGALMGLVPGGTFIFDKLNEYGIIQSAFDWVSAELKLFNLSLERIERTIEETYEALDLTPRFGFFDENLAVVVSHFTGLKNDVVSFAESLVDHIIELIKEAALGVAEGLLNENQAWSLLKKILKHDPLRDVPVEATTAEIIADFLILIGKQTELEQMRERGTLQETADWLDTQIDTFRGLLGQLRALITAAWNAIQPENLPKLGTNLQQLATQTFGFLQRVWDFALTVAVKVLELIKKALLGWLSRVAHETPGFFLLTVLIGRDPFTNEPVERNAENILKGFITLLPGGEDTFKKLQETGAISQAAGRIEAAAAELGITWDFVVGLFSDIWNSLSIADLINPIGAFIRIVEQFGEPLARLFAFIRVVLEEVFKIVLQLMNFPTDLIESIITNAMQAYENIKADPMAFFMNMLAAVKLGFQHFFDNILNHLLSGLTDWLFSAVREAGIEPPADLSLQSILDFVLQVLGISMEQIWTKLGERFGEENIARVRRLIDRVTGIWSFVRDVQERGVAAIWEYVESQLSNLWDMVLEQAKNWIMETIVNRVITKLLSMLDPTGIMAVINGFMAFFNAVQSVIKYMRQILEIINDYVTTIAAVARGEVEPGAQKVEQGLAHAIPVAIGFLANQVGLGNLGEKIQEIIAGLRELVDQALNWLLDKAQQAWEGLMRTLGFGQEESSGDPEHDAKVEVGLAAIDTKEQQYQKEGKIKREEAEQVVTAVKADHPVFTKLMVIDGGDSWDYEYEASPKEKKESKNEKEEESIIIVEVADVKPPGSSRIGALPPVSADVADRIRRGDKSAARLFEGQVGGDLAASQGLPPPVPRKEYMRSQSNQPFKRGELPSQLPSDAQLVYEPRVNLGGGNDAGDIYKLPDWVVLSPSGVRQVEVFEVTLDANFGISEGTPGSPSHKQVQISGTILGLVNRYPGVPIKYNIRSHVVPSDKAKKELEDQLKIAREGGADVQIIWRFG